MNPLIQCKPIILPLFIAGVLACFGILPKALAVVPPPDGGYPGFNTAEGQNALFSLTTGVANTANGWFSLFSNTGGNLNTGVGAGTLLFNTGNDNTAIGAAALLFNTTGSDSTAVGTAALVNNIAGANTGIGAFALQANTTGGNLGTTEGVPVGPNTAIGSHALESNTIASGNTAVGYQALGSMVAGADFGNGPTDVGISTAVGFQALASVNGPSNEANDAFGYRALFSFADGSGNVAIGTRALIDLTDGFINVAVGPSAGSGLTSGNANVYIGGIAGAPNENFHTYISNINSTSVSGGGTDTVAVNLMTGLLGHLSSSRRHKEEIKPMDNASETLYRLKPVTYRYKKEIDHSQVLDYGLVAEDVAEIDPNLTACNKDGEIESVRYTAINAMLLNEFLKEHRKNQEQEATIARLTSTDAKQEAMIANQQKQIEALTADLQKVSAQIELNKLAPQIVENND
jgi:hypothetical protein